MNERVGGAHHKVKSYDIIIDCADMCVQTIFETPHRPTVPPTPSKVLRKCLNGAVRRPTLPTDQTTNNCPSTRVSQASTKQEYSLVANKARKAPVGGKGKRLPPALGKKQREI